MLLHRRAGGGGDLLPAEQGELQPVLVLLAVRRRHGPEVRPVRQAAAFDAELHHLRLLRRRRAHPDPVDDGEVEGAPQLQQVRQSNFWDFIFNIELEIATANRSNSKVA